MDRAVASFMTSKGTSKREPSVVTKCCNQAIALIDPTMSEMAIFQQVGNWCVGLHGFSS
jgi:hypothetical protein